MLIDLASGASNPKAAENLTAEGMIGQQKPEKTEAQNNDTSIGQIGWNIEDPEGIYQLNNNMNLYWSNINHELTIVIRIENIIYIFRLSSKLI